MPDLTVKSVVICGPSGVGKGTVISNLIDVYPHQLGLSVSHTTRKPRFAFAVFEAHRGVKQHTFWQKK